MIRPNELSDPGTRAAWARVEALFEELDALGPSVPLVPTGSRFAAGDRAVLLDRAEDLADRLGRGELLHAATEHLDAALSSRLAGPVYRYSTNTARPEDLVAVSRALHDLLLVTIVEDRLAPDDTDRLAAAGRFVLGIQGGGAVVIEPPPGGIVIQEPSEADWADAEAGPEAVDPNASPIGSRGVMAAGLWAIGLMVAVGLLAVGIAAGELALGVGGAIVALLVAGTFANRR